MEQSCHSSLPSTTNGTTSNSNINSGAAGAAADGGKATAVQNALRALNRSSYKISKPTTVRNLPQLPGDGQDAARQTPTLQVHNTQGAAAAAPQPPPHQPQPPVYNINKNDFRDVVQKLTGSPAHLNPPPQPAAAPNVGTAGGGAASAAAASSRLQKNRPPPLAHLGPRVQPPLSQPELPTAGPSVVDGAAAGVGNASYLRPWMATPLSPLPPLPTVSAAAESPITAYMRSLRGGGSGGHQQLPGPLALSSPMGAPLFPLPSSPLAFGCLPSPQSAYQMTLPSSPRLPIPSPKWKDA